MSRTEESWKDYVADALRDGQRRMDRMEGDIRKNTELTERVDANTQEFLTVFTSMKGGFRVLGWFGAALKWVTVTAAAASMFWKMITGRWPFL